MIFPETKSTLFTWTVFFSFSTIHIQEDNLFYLKKWRGTRNPSCEYDLLEETSPSFKWIWDLVWRVEWSAHRTTSQSFKQWEENFTQHWTTFVQFWHWVGSNSGPQRVSTFNLWCQRFHCSNEVLKILFILTKSYSILLIFQWKCTKPEILERVCGVDISSNLSYIPHNVFRNEQEFRSKT